MRGTSGARDLAIAAGIITALSRFVPDPFVWPIGAALFAGVVVGALQVVGEADPAGESSGVAIESVILPGVAAMACLAAIRLVPIGLWLALAAGGVIALFGLTLSTELRLARASGPPSSADRTAVLTELLLVGFLAFVGIAGLVPGGLPPPGAEPGGRPEPLALGGLGLGDGLVGALLAYRAAALRTSSLRDVGWFAITAGLVVGMAAVAVRSIDTPAVLGPALLVLVFFLWDVIHGGSSRRRGRARLWEAAALAVLAVIVVGWTLGLRA